MLKSQSWVGVMLHNNLSRHVLEFFWTRSEPGADFMWILRQMGRVSFAENLVNQFHWSQLPLMEGKIWCSLRHSALPERILKRVHFKLTLGYISIHPIWQIWEDGFKFKLWSGGGGIITLWQQLLLWREMSTLQTCTLYMFNQTVFIQLLFVL